MEKRAYPLERLTSLRIGGPADLLVFPETEAELAAALARASNEGVAVRALGGGRNLLVDSRGVEGMVLSFSKLRGVRIGGNLVVAKAGTPLPELLGKTVAAGLAGLEGLTGVPGTVGGAVRMNAGSSFGTIGDRVRWVRGFTRGGAPIRFGREACGFRYRGSRLDGTFVTEVALDLAPAKGDLKGRVREIFLAKRRTQPLDAATAGCTFKNPDLPGGESAGWLLDRAGLRGRERGGARFSPKHANFLENRGGATSKDVRWLIDEARRRVLERFGILLELEVEVWNRSAVRDGVEAA